MEPRYKEIILQLARLRWKYFLAQLGKGIFLLLAGVILLLLIGEIPYRLGKGATLWAISFYGYLLWEKFLIGWERELLSGQYLFMDICSLRFWSLSTWCEKISGSVKDISLCWEMD